MVTKTGDRRIYDQFAAACATNTQDPTDDTVMLVFTEEDNRTTHMFQMSKDHALQYTELIKQTVAGQKIQVAPASALNDLDRKRRA